MSPDLPPSTSASQLTTYALCPRKYAFTYVYGVEPEFRSVSLILGSALHGAIGWWFTERLEGRTPGVSDAEAVLMADLTATTADVNVRWKMATPESLEADARRYLSVYLERHKDLDVAAVEQPFKVDLEDPETGEVVGRPLKGYFDLVLANRRVVELKTSSRAWTEFELVRHLQVGGYAFVWNTLHGGPSQVDVHVIVKLKREPRVDAFAIERGETATRWWLRAAGAIEAAIEAGQFPPTPSALCIECEFEKACAAWVEDPPALVTKRRLPVSNDNAAFAFAL
jgi:putative RecB family exonuclease